jgi:hypothetical protein
MSGKIFSRMEALVVADHLFRALVTASSPVDVTTDIPGRAGSIVLRSTHEGVSVDIYAGEFLKPRREFYPTLTRFCERYRIG